MIMNIESITSETITRGNAVWVHYHPWYKYG